MAKQHLPQENRFKNEIIKDYRLEEEIGRGKIGVVYRGYHKYIKELIADVNIIPKENLQTGWEVTLKKIGLLVGIPQVVQYKNHDTIIWDGIPYVCIFWEYIDGDNLREYAEKNPDNITLPFIGQLIEQILTLFAAMKAVGTSHGDLHEGNILIVFDDRLPYPLKPIIKVGGFAFGGSCNDLKLEDDYTQFAFICHNLLDKYIDPSKLGGDDHNLYERVVHILRDITLSSKSHRESGYEEMYNVRMKKFAHDVKKTFEELSKMLSIRVQAFLEPKYFPKIFLCYAGKDRERVEKLYERLRKDGFDPWMDKKSILPGQDWKLEIRLAIEDADFFVACISRYTQKKTYSNKEIKLALEVLDTMPEDAIFLIPLRLEDCPVEKIDTRLANKQWVDLFAPGGYETLLRSLRSRMQ